MSTIKIEFTDGDNGNSIFVEGWVGDMADLNRLYRVCAAWFGEVPPVWVTKETADKLAGAGDGTGETAEAGRTVKWSDLPQGGHRLSTGIIHADGTFVADPGRSGGGLYGGGGEGAASNPDRGHRGGISD
jgi:hypothetical protein